MLGEYTHSVDNKGRVIMPSDLREEIGDKFYVTQGMEGCIFVFHKNEWDAITEKVKAMGWTSKKARAFNRKFFGSAREVELDKQGRFVIPQNLRTYAQIDKDATFVGMPDRAEIWNPEKYDEYSNQVENGYDQIFDDEDEGVSL